MVKEAAERLAIKQLLATEEALIPAGLTGQLVAPALMKKMSSQVAPEGVIAEVEFALSPALQHERYLLVLDNLQDPGNVGALVRTALALGWEAVVLLGSTTDPFSPKALRAAKGATFRMPIVSMTPQQLATYCQGLPLIAADAQGRVFSRVGPCALILGNEGQGLSPAVLQLDLHKVSIPLVGDMESLNVAAAGAILLQGLK